MSSRRAFIYFALLFWGGSLSSVPCAAEEMDYTLTPRGNYNTYLRAQNVAVLGVSVNGIVAEIYHEAQDFVKEGDLLMQLDAEQIKLEIQKLQANIDMFVDLDKAKTVLEYAQDNLKIVTELYEKKVSSDKEFKEANQRKDLAELDVKAAMLQLKLLELNKQQNEDLLKRHSICAPMNGVIVPFSSVPSLKDANLKKLEVGETVNNGQKVMVIMKVDTLRVSVSLPVEQLGTVQIGQETRVFVQGDEGAGIPAKVVFIGPTVYETGQFDVEVEFANPVIANEKEQKDLYPYTYRPGLRARMEL
jgi:RND family efflux transporter MFP subunit